MDNLTHTLTGICLSRAGFNRKTRWATVALVIGSNLPDADLVQSLWSHRTYLEYHRAITHSLLGMTVLSVALTGVLILAAPALKPRQGAPPLDRGWLLACCAVGVFGHGLLDFTNAYGIRPFLPFQGKWYAWDIMPILDPILWGVLLLGVLMPPLFAMISEEVGARKTGYRRGAVVALVGMACLWGIRDFSHRRAVDLLAANNFGDEPPVAVGAFPTLDPRTWNGIAETDSAYHKIEVHAFGGNLAVDHAAHYPKPEPSPALQAALATHLGRVFTDFARFPWTEVEAIPVAGGEPIPDSDANPAAGASTAAGGVAAPTGPVDGYVIHIHDLRFGVNSGFFQATIELDRNLAERHEHFGAMPQPPDR